MNLETTVGSHGRQRRERRQKVTPRRSHLHGALSKKQFPVRTACAPMLTLIPEGANVILTWPTNAFGFTLQSTTNLGLPADCSTNSPASVVIGGQNVIINPISGPQKFYRLRH
jgi:hypothetical protein